MSLTNRAVGNNVAYRARYDFYVQFHHVNAGSLAKFVGLLLRRKSIGPWWSDFRYQVVYIKRAFSMIAAGSYFVYLM